MGLSNSYFRFKQFTVNQGECAMKVTTDACIQGAWTTVATDTKRILDIGTGTGLLALMLAQKATNVLIDAAELDNEAAAQARQNFSDSPWNERLNVISCDIKEYHAPYKYELIISNPPFFNNSLQGPAANRNMARHTDTLSYNDLLDAIDRNLAPKGLTSILLPRPESLLFGKLIEEKGWHIHNCLQIKDNNNAAIKRVVLLTGRVTPNVRATETLVIKQHDGSYTDRFKQLLSPYYLQL